MDHQPGFGSDSPELQLARDRQTPAEPFPISTSNSLASTRKGEELDWGCSCTPLLRAVSPPRVGGTRGSASGHRDMVHMRAQTLTFPTLLLKGWTQEPLDAGLLSVLKQSSSFPLWETALKDSHLPYPVCTRVSEIKDLILHSMFFLK